MPMYDHSRLMTSKSRSLVDWVNFLVCTGGTEVAASLRVFRNSAFAENWRPSAYICCFSEPIICYRVQIGWNAGQSIIESPFMTYMCYKLVVAFAEYDGALSCINMTLRRLDKGRTWIHMAATQIPTNRNTCQLDTFRNTNRTHTGVINYPSTNNYIFATLLPSKHKIIFTSLEDSTHSPAIYIRAI